MKDPYNQPSPDWYLPLHEIQYGAIVKAVFTDNLLKVAI